jgi:hypothetical protein
MAELDPIPFIKKLRKAAKEAETRNSLPEERLRIKVKTQQKEEGFIERKPVDYSKKKEVESGMSIPFVEKKPDLSKYPVVMFHTREVVSHADLIPIGRSRITGYDVYRWKGSDSLILKGFGYRFEELIDMKQYGK